MKENLKLYQEMLYSADKIGMWIWNKDRKLLSVSCPDAKDFQIFLDMGSGLDYVFSPERDKTKPVMLSDSIGLCYLADYMPKEEKDGAVVLIGPVFAYEFSQMGIEQSLRRMNFSVENHRRLLPKLKKVPVVDQRMMERYGAMLHYVLTGRTAEKYEYDYQCRQPQDYRFYDEQAFCTEEWGGKYEMLNETDGRMVEKMLLQAVEAGDVGFDFEENAHLSARWHGTYSMEAIKRPEKNTLVIFNALCARAAFKGGLSAKKTTEMELYYLNKIESMETLSELTLLNRTLFRDYVEQVHACKSHPEVSKPIQEACDYIQRNLLKDFGLKDVADEVGYTEYYLTRKFKREVGISFHDYVKKNRIDLARVWLQTTDLSIQQISEQLNFSTRNYFSKIFTQQVGMSPAAYRQSGRNGTDVPRKTEER